MAGPNLLTERLSLSPFEDVDVSELHELFVGAEMRRYLLDDTVVPRAWVEEEVAGSRARFAQDTTCGLWSCRLGEAADIVGFVGFRPFFEPPELQLLYGFTPAVWGRGLATEAAAAAIAYGFDALGFDEVRAATDTPNAASIAVLRRLGMQERRRSTEGEHGTLFFRVSAGEWEGTGRRVTKPRS